MDRQQFVRQQRIAHRASIDGRALVKYTVLAKLVPDDVDYLEDAVIETVGDVHFDQLLLRSLFHAAGLYL